MRIHKYTILTISELNSFSFEDGMCTGYSFWIDSSSELIVGSASEDSMVLYVADSQLTQYQENESNYYSAN